MTNCRERRSLKSLKSRTNKLSLEVLSLPLPILLFYLFLSFCYSYRYNSFSNKVDKHLHVVVVLPEHLPKVGSILNILYYIIPW